MNIPNDAVYRRRRSETHVLASWQRWKEETDAVIVRCGGNSAYAKREEEDSISDDLFYDYPRFEK